MKAGSPNPRSAAWNILNRVFTKPEQNIFLDHEYSRWIRREHYPQRDRGLLVGLVRGVVKHHATLGSVLGQYVPRSSDIPAAVNILLKLGIYQLARMTRIPAYAVVDESVNLVERSAFRGFRSLVNAVLRNISRRRDSLIQDAEKWGMDLPLWLEEEWCKWIGFDEFDQLKRVLAQPPVLVLRPARVGEGRQELAQQLENKGIRVESDPLSPHALRTTEDYTVLKDLLGTMESGFYIQDSGSLVTVDVLDPRPGEKVVEIGCGSGGKTIQIARLMKNQGIIVAVDRDPNKLLTLRNASKQAGIDIIDTVCAKVEDLDTTTGSLADRILVDAPCSGLGTLRRNPELALAIRPSDLDCFAARQIQMVSKASSMVKNGGLLVYCVCTITRKETREVVETFEKSHGGLFYQVLVGNIFQTETRGSGLPIENTLELWPHRYGSDGFFIAAWRKKWSSRNQA